MIADNVIYVFREFKTWIINETDYNIFFGVIIVEYVNIYR